MQGSGGGPLESNTTAFLVRSLSSGWTKGCLLAVDAGVHLSGIQSIIESIQSTDPSGQLKPSSSSIATLPVILRSGSFAGLSLPFQDAKANAGHIVKTLVDTYLITHPHLDHISGLVVNTAALPGTRPKRIAALPSTIHAFKQHIFNNVIWPNLSDENDGAGLVTYMRLVEGGSPALGFGVGRDSDGLGPAGLDGAKGYVEITEGLSVKTWSVSHGHCMENHWHRGSSVGHHGGSPMGQQGLGIIQDHFQDTGKASPFRRQSSNPYASIAGYGGGKGYQSPMPYFPSHQPSGDKECVYDSSAYFIRDIGTGREVLIFGDVEPDSISLSPRNHRVWEDAAPKVAARTLKAIFIECSYDERQSDDTLFGHLCPRFLMEELQALARQVVVAKQLKAVENRQREMSRGRNEERKRKRISGSMVGTPTQSTFRTRNRSRDTSPLGLEVSRDGGGYVDPRPTRRDFLHQASGSLESSELSSPDIPHDSVTALLLESATRKKELKRERNRLHRQSSSVSPHSRPMHFKESLNGMNMDTFELDNHAPARARPSLSHRSHSASGQRPRSTSGNRPGSNGGIGEWSDNTTRQERMSKESITEENEGSGDVTPTDGLTPLNSTYASQSSIPKLSNHASTFPREQKHQRQGSEIAHISPHQTLPHNSLGVSHEPSSGHLSPTKRNDDRIMDIKAFSTSPAQTFFIDPARANQHDAGGDGARSPVIEAIRNSEFDHVEHKERTLGTQGILKGLKIVIIHVKERLDDEEPAGETILRELRGFEVEEGLGVEFVLSERGLSVFV